MNGRGAGRRGPGPPGNRPPPPPPPAHNPSNPGLWPDNEFTSSEEESEEEPVEYLEAESNVPAAPPPRRRRSPSPSSSSTPTPLARSHKRPPAPLPADARTGNALPLTPPPRGTRGGGAGGGAVGGRGGGGKPGGMLTSLLPQRPTRNEDRSPQMSTRTHHNHPAPPSPPHQRLEEARPPPPQPPSQHRGNNAARSKSDTSDSEDEKPNQKSFLHNHPSRSAKPDIVKEMKEKFEKTQLPHTLPGATGSFARGNTSHSTNLPPRDRDNDTSGGSIRSIQSNSSSNQRSNKNNNNNKSGNSNDDPESEDDAIYDDHVVNPGLESFRWFSGSANRKDAERQVRSRGVDGSFLVRNASKPTDEYPYSLTILYAGKTFNLNLRRRQDGRFAVGGEKRGEDSFESIPDLVTFYSAEQKILLKPAGSDGPAGETFLTSA